MCDMDTGLSNRQYQSPHMLESRFPVLAMDTNFKLDEGYSEDSRSVDDGDSAMGLEPRNNSQVNLLSNPLTAIQNAVMALDESQRSGEAHFLSSVPGKGDSD